MSNSGYNMPPGCYSVPGDDMSPICEECPDELFDNCPGEESCPVWRMEMGVACCLKHKWEFMTRNEMCPTCEYETFYDPDDPIIQELQKMNCPGSGLSLNVY